MLLLILGCAGNSEVMADPLDTAPATWTEAPDSGAIADSGSPPAGPTSLTIGEAPPDFSLIDTNPSSATYQQPVVPSKQLGVVTGWYFFKSS